MPRLSDIRAKRSPPTRRKAAGPAAVTPLPPVPGLRISRPARSARGEVFLVGAGPGDPELLTLRALRLMEETDVVVYDSLVSEEILALVPARAERIYAGKRSGNHSLKQEEINKLLVGLARRGRRVLRLKGGDPFIFGRGGEEMQFLAAHGVPFVVIPGVTSASGAACYAGIPLTHRDCAQSIVIATGHPRQGNCQLDWDMLARPRQTVVIYMGLGRIGEICAGLIAHGRSADTPAAAVERATTDAQRVIVGTLRSLAAECKRRNVRSPSLIIVGEVVSLHGELGWFDAARTAGLSKAALA